jgi:hypothetical protein
MKQNWRGERERGDPCARDQHPASDDPGATVGDEPWTAERLTRQRALRAAILIDAIRCLMGLPGVHDPRARDAALRWVLSADTKAPFSFQNVCESLGLHPSRIRRAILTPALGSEDDLRRAIRQQRASAERRGRRGRLRLVGGRTS